MGKHKKIKQITILYLAMLIGIIISISISAITTKILGPRLYGDYKFLQNLFALTTTCITFGVFVSAGRLLASSSNDELQKSELMGGVFLVTTGLSIILMVVMLMFSFFIDDIFGNNIGWIIRYGIPLLFVFPFQTSIECILKGDNRIYDLSVFKIAPGALYLASLLFLSRQDDLSLFALFLLYLFCMAFICVIMFFRIHPSFRVIKKNIIHLAKETRTYGFNVYQGILAGTATNMLGGVLVAYILDSASVGFFLLAQTITMPLVMIFSSIGTTFYKSFYGSKFIPANALWATLCIALVTLVTFLYFISDVISFIYPDEFQPVIKLCKIMALGAVMLGVGDFINNYICANGYGRLSRNAAYARGAINLVGFTLLVKYFGIEGAAYTTLLAGLGYYFSIHYFYLRIKENIK